MRFELLDSIQHLDDQRILASRYLDANEDYLADHFPKFPVMPGVLMLEALTQAATWLIHRRTEFAKSFVVLKEARNVRYGQFVAPGHTLVIEVELMKPTASGGLFKGMGTVDGQTALTARIEMVSFDLAEKCPRLAELDEKLKRHTQKRWNALTRQGATV